MAKSKHKRRRRDNGAQVKPKKTLRLPVDVADEDGEDEHEYEDAEDIDEDDAEGYDDGEDDADEIEATELQVRTAQLHAARQGQLELMQINANLEEEIAKLRREVADTRIQKLRDQAAAITAGNASLLEEVNLRDGDNLRKNEDGKWVIVRKRQG